MERIFSVWRELKKRAYKKINTKQNANFKRARDHPIFFSKQSFPRGKPIDISKRNYIALHNTPCKTANILVRAEKKGYDSQNPIKEKKIGFWKLQKGDELKLWCANNCRLTSPVVSLISIKAETTHKVAHSLTQANI